MKLPLLIILTQSARARRASAWLQVHYLARLQARVGILVHPQP